MSSSNNAFCVSCFGAVGDGTTNDAAAIQAAEDYASANNLDVYFPAGTYLCGSVIYRKGNTDWRGDGMYLSVLKHSGGADTHNLVYVVDLDVSYDHIGFYNMGFDGNRSGSVNPNVSRIVVYLDRNPDGGDDAPSKDARFIGCRLFNFSYGNMGLHIKGYTGVQVKDSIFEDGGSGLYHPVYLRRCADVLVDGNTVTGRDGNSCIKVQISPLSIISNNICRDGGRGISAQDAIQYTITGNTIDGSTEEGIASTIDSAANSESVSITGNTISNVVGGINTSGLSFFTITGNTITAFSSFGMKFRSSVDGACSGNTLRTADSSGGDVTFVNFDAGPNPCRINMTGNWLRTSRPSGNTYAFYTNETTTSGIATALNTLSGIFTADYTGFYPYDINGVFTPVVIGSSSAGTGTYSVQVGRYQKTGNRVSFNLRVSWSAHTGTGNLRISGLPFTSNSVANNHSGCAIGEADNIALTANNVLLAYIPSNSTQLLLTQYPTGGGAWVPVPLDTAGSLTISGDYELKP
jgi:hypothetical protein